MRPLRPTHGVTHERARELLASSLDEPLAPGDTAWLTDHLAGCETCQQVSADYRAQRDELRSLPAPQPPRDLWARTSAALDAAERTAGRSHEPRHAPRGGRSPALIGTLAAACVVAVVVGSSLLAGLGGPMAAPSAPGTSVPGASLAPGATPMAVPVGNVGWVTRQADGTYALNLAEVSNVCPADAQQACAPLDGSARQVVTLDTKPGVVVLSSQRPEAVLAGAPGQAAGIFVVTLPAASSQPTVPPMTSGPPGTPTPAPTSGQSPTAPPAATPTTTPIVSPSGPSLAGSGEPSESAAPAPQSTQAILDGAVMVGTSASYSGDGQWFAFTARPADGSHGPDIYVWHVGDAKARPVTADHASIFSDWLGDLVVGSSASPAPPAASIAPSEASPGAPSTPASPAVPATGKPRETGQPSQGSPLASMPAYPALPSPVETLLPSAGGTAIPRSFLLDPATGVQQQLQGAVWRPVVDPTDTYVAFWSGSLRYDAHAGWVPDRGDLYLAAWSSISQLAPGQPDLLPAPSGAPLSSQPATPQASASWAAVPSSPSLAPATVSPPQLLEPDQAGSDIPATDWDIRWDTAGQHLAAWVADAVDPTVGRLSLLTVDRSTGLLDPAHQLLADAPALSGYSIGDDQLAWATPPGQDGEGSHVMVLGWRGDEAGKIRTLPAAGMDAVVVVR